MNTDEQYDAVVERCRKVFLLKTNDYGTSWRVYRTISVVDQLYIKAKRIRTIQEKGKQRVEDSIANEFAAIINYAVIGLVQLHLSTNEVEELDVDTVAHLYNTQVALAKALMHNKNHDYGEAWRDLSQESFTDLILSKLLRIRQILANHGVTLASEGIDANYFDILNYAVFAMILMDEGKHLAV